MTRAEMIERPKARLRIKYLDYHNPKVWGVFYDGFWKYGCLCHAPTLPEAVGEALAWFGTENFARAEGWLTEFDAKRALLRSEPSP